MMRVTFEGRDYTARPDTASNPRKARGCRVQLAAYRITSADRKMRELSDNVVIIRHTARP